MKKIHIFVASLACLILMLSSIAHAEQKVPLFVNPHPEKQAAKEIADAIKEIINQPDNKLRMAEESEPGLYIYINTMQSNDGKGTVVYSWLETLLPYHFLVESGMGYYTSTNKQEVAQSILQTALASYADYLQYMQKMKPQQ